MRFGREAARRAAGIVCAVLLAASQLLAVLAPSAALAADDVRYFYCNLDGDVGPFVAGIFGCYQDMNDASESGVAYCMDGTKHGPGEQRYTRTGEADAVLSYIVAKGYPNTTTICGRTLTAGQARAVTQCAVWYHRDYDLADQGVSSGEKYELYLLGVQLCKEAEAYAASGGQPMGCGSVWYTSEDRQLILLTSKPYGSISLGKASADTTISASNGLYSLAGAEYGVFSDEACTTKVATITTDADGNGSATGIVAGTYWVKEISAPDGFALDGRAIKVTVTAGAESKADASDQPQSNPLGIVVEKVDADAGASAQGDASLAGAEFRVDYYAGSYDASSLPSKPTRSWVLRTAGDGTALLDGDHLVSGDELYLSSEGTPTIPLGTVAITETKPPEGYRLTDSSAHIVHITARGSSETVRTYVAPEVPDEVIRGGMALQKRDLELDVSTPQGSASLDATYTIYNRSSSAVSVGGKMYGSGEAIWSGTADPDDGTLETAADLLPYGTYEVRETGAATGYLPDSDWSWSFSVREDGRIYSPDDDQQNADEVVRGGMSLAKRDLELDGSTPQGDASLDATYTIYSLNERQVIVDGTAYSKGEAVWCGTADPEDGSLATSADLLPYGTYEVRETAPAKGYLPDEGWSWEFSITADGQMCSPDEGQANADQVIHGGMSLQKRDLELDGSTPQGDASLDATYTIYNRSDHAVLVNGMLKDPGEAIWSGTADPDDGSLATPARLLPYGTYEVRETGAATGYLPEEDWSWSFSVREDGVVYSPGKGEHNADRVIRGGLDVAKQDRETLRFRPLGGATLEGAELTIYNMSERAVLVNGSLVQPLDACLTLRTGADGMAFAASDSLPYGTYLVRETKAPKGYLLNQEWSRTFEVREDGSVALLSSTDDAVADQVIRGDLRLVKVHGTTMARLSGIPFAVTSATTGESHVVVTDANGQIDTSSSWNPHSQRTNANDTAVSDDGTVDEDMLDPDAGIWFTGATDIQTEPIDSLGALPYDTYELRELRVSANEGLELVTFSVTVTRHGVSVDGGTVDDSPGPSIRTELSGAEGAHLVGAAERIELVDTVWYENLQPGRTYDVRGILVDKGTGEALLDAEGDAIVSETSFTPMTSAGTVELRFSFTMDPAQTITTVAFESLEEDGVEIAVHADIDDEGQTVRIPQVGTTAADSETVAHMALADGEVAIVDTVTYSNLLLGEEYELSGTLMDRETGEPVSDGDGNAVNATIRFTPDETDGEVEIELSFDATSLAGHDVVVFERLYLGEVEVARHTDIDDEGQTVHIPRIGTTATAGGEHEATASEGIVITDTIAYGGLIPGEEYLVEGRLVDKATGEPIDEAEASASFTPDKPSGTVEVQFTIDASDLSGHGVVAFERISWQGHLVAVHEDLEDEGQTVRFPEIGTTAEDGKDGGHVITAAKGARIIDTVSYRGLTPGEEYTVTGTLMDRESGKALRGPDDRPITASASFTPSEQDGQVTVTFEFDAAGLAGHDVVAFEAVARGEVEVAAHEDLDDDGQTVHVEAPDIPGALPNTGDSSGSFVLLAALTAIGAGLMAVGVMTVRHGGRHERTGYSGEDLIQTMPDLGDEDGEP